MIDRLVTVATFDNLVEAHMARNCLEAAGLKSFLMDEETVGMAWHLSNALGGVKLQVGEEDADEALAVLAEAAPSTSTSADSQEAISCPPTDASPQIEVEEAEPEEPELVLNEREMNADRAMRGAVLGLLLVPLQFYVFWLLLKVFMSKERLSPVQRRHAVIATLINLPMVMIMLLWFCLFVRAKISG